MVSTNSLNSIWLSAQHTAGVSCATQLGGQLGQPHQIVLLQPHDGLQQCSCVEVVHISVLCILCLPVTHC
jgi:hypothetical protein